MAFFKGSRLYRCIFLLFTISRLSSGLNNDEIKLSPSPLLNNQIEVNTFTLVKKSNRTLPHAVESIDSFPTVISSKPESTVLTRRSLFTHMDFYQPSLSEGNPLKNIKNITGNTKDFFSEQDLTDIVGYKDETVTMPDLPCETDPDCQKWDSGAPMFCEEGQCQCSNDLCWHYQLQSQSGGYLNVFSCKECGSLGSACLSSDECEDPGSCWTDNFCHCDAGINYYNICLIQTVGFENNLLTFVLGTTFITLVFVFCCIAYQPSIYAYCWRTCHRINTDEQDQQNAADRRRTRRLRRHKSPAFTHTEIFRDTEEQQSV